MKNVNWNNCVTSDFLLWNFLNDALTRPIAWNTLQPLVYNGPFNGSEFDFGLGPIDPTKIYLALELEIEGDVTGLLPAQPYWALLDQAGLPLMNISNSIPIWNSIAIQYMNVDIVRKKLWFCAIQQNAPSAGMKFIGYRLSIV
jgi:hypothetical protein